MSGTVPSLRTLFVGGPGRSGTTVVAQRIAEMDEAVAFPGIELKFFTEKNGILDLWHSLGEHYSPNRAVVAMRQFRQFTGELIDGRFSQTSFALTATAADWHALFDTFTASLSRNGHPEPTTAERFDASVRTLVAGIHRLALQHQPSASDTRIFVDNTPHAVLEAPFLSRLLPGSAFLHVMRDPRSIAQSLRRMPWGPPELEQCCTWLDGYCRAWADRCTDGDNAVRSVFIEDLAADPHGIGAGIGTWLGIGDVGRYFAYTDPETLNGWVRRADADDLSLLNRRLSDWVAFFGYSPEAVGCRANGPSSILPAAAAPASDRTASVASAT